MRCRIEGRARYEDAACEDVVMVVSAGRVSVCSIWSDEAYVGICTAVVVDELSFDLLCGAFETFLLEVSVARLLRS